MLYIRTDSNNIIATGHVMRCLSIANMMRKNGEDCIFITADSYSNELINSNGFETICLNSKWNELDEELEALINIIKDRKIQKLLIDSYAVTKNYLITLKKYTKLIYIDDINLFTYPVDLLINYSGTYKQFKYNEQYKNMQTKLLLGYDYVPLREEFHNINILLRENVKQILFTMGGTDQNNITAKFIENIIKSKIYNNIVFHIVVGSFNENLEVLNELIANYSNIKLHYNVKKISEIMRKCDIAISAGGTTLLELCACGIPTISFTIADNQIEGTQNLSDNNIIMYAGDARKDIVKMLKWINNCIYELCSDYELRQKYSANMKLLIDGNGAMKISEEILLL